MSAIFRNLQVVRANIVAAAHIVSRASHSVCLLAVSKNFGPDAVVTAVLAGQRAFGENYVQEAIEKMAVVRTVQPNLLLEWHFIGPIQSNKTRLIAENFDWVQSVASEKIAQRLSNQRPPEMVPLNVCLQINISEAASKSGIALNQAADLAHAVSTMAGLRLRGLMAIPDASDAFEAQRLPFQKMRQLFEQLQAQGLALDTLSMGMSADMQAAIAEGATMVRIGSAIFGQRHTI